MAWGIGKCVHVAEVVPQSERYFWQQDAALPATAEFHAVVIAFGRWRINRVYHDIVFCGLSHYYFYCMRARQMLHYIAFYRLAVYRDGLDAFAHTIGILHGNMIFRSAELALHVEAFPV